MQRTSKILTAVISLLWLMGAQAQEKVVNQYPDTLVVTTDSRNVLTFAFRDIHKEKPELNNELWRSILGIMESSLQASSKKEGVRISYRKVTISGEEKAKIEVAALEESDIFWIGKDGMRQDASYRIVFEVVQPRVRVLFSLNSIGELDEIKEINVESIWDTEMEKANTKRVVYNGEGSIELGVFRVNKINHSNPADFIEFRGGVGVGFYRDRFIPDVSYDISFNFSDRYGKPRTKVGLQYNLHYVLEEQTEGDFDLNLNGFLSAYWTMFRGTNREYGLGFGYLVKQNGTLFKGDTFKMTLFNRRASKTSLTPELIFTDGFKQAFPALRFGLAF